MGLIAGPLAFGGCMSAEARGKVLDVLAGCPPYQEEVAFSRYVPETRQVAGKGSEDEGFGLEEGELAKLGTAKYLDKMFTGIKGDFEKSGIDLKEIEGGFEALGLKLEKVVGPDGKTQELKIALDGTIGFELGSARLTKIAAELVGKIGKAMNAYPETKAKLGGHVDCCAPRNYNLKLSQARSDAAKNELINAHKIAEPRILESIGYADDRMLIPVRSLEPRNRRVEIIIVTNQ